MSDHWDFYLCHVDDKPASIFLDMGIAGDIPIPEQQTVVWLRLFLRLPRDDGLSSSEDHGRLVEIDDAIGEAAESLPKPTCYVGRSTGDGKRDFFLYASDKSLLASCLRQTMSAFPEYAFEVGGRDDPDWTLYREFLYPDAWQKQCMGNQSVVAKLLDDGDSLEKPREVTHWLYFDSSDAREAAVQASSKRGFVTQETRDEDRFVLVTSRVDSVDLGSINTATYELFDIATQLGGEYDGWETSVESD